MSKWSILVIPILAAALALLVWVGVGRVQGRVESAEQNVIVPEIKWVEVKNPGGVENSNSTFKFNEECVIWPGEETKIVAADGDDYLVEYKCRDSYGGTSCPSGTLFVVPKETYASWIGKYEKDQKALDDHYATSPWQRDSTLDMDEIEESPKYDCLNPKDDGHTHDELRQQPPSDPNFPDSNEEEDAMSETYFGPIESVTLTANGTLEVVRRKEECPPYGGGIFKDIYHCGPCGIELVKTIEGKVIPAKTIPEAVEWPEGGGDR